MSIFKGVGSKWELEMTRNLSLILKVNNSTLMRNKIQDQNTNEYIKKKNCACLPYFIETERSKTKPSTLIIITVF
jgi:hypothetical protein